MKIYLVGGAVRDELLGIKSKDLDYVMVLESILDLSVEDGFKIMEDYMVKEGFQIFFSTPDMFTIRAKFPKGHIYEKQDADFVLARKETGYIEGTRKPKLELGTLEDDLIRRDFTINAMAKDIDGKIIDLFGGINDLKNGILRTPQDPSITMMEDPLRLIRAIRFSITKNMNIHYDIWKVMCSDWKVTEKLKQVVSKERIQSEINKCFKYNTKETLKQLELIRREGFYDLYDIIFPDGYHLELTNKQYL